jgi:hypothetical protein
MNRYLRIGAALFAVSSLSACATVLRGTNQKYEITSVPPGADVELSTGQTCVTPCKLKLKRKTPFTVTVKKDGFETATAQVESKFTGAGAGAGNILLGGVIGAVVDSSNGSMRSLRPNPLEVTLVPAGGAAPQQ